MSTIDIRTIQIILDTNIVGKEIVPLTKSILYQPDLKGSEKWNDLPYFTMDVEYPEGSLSTLSYVKQMEFFFDKQKMTEFIQLKTKKKQDTEPSVGLSLKNGGSNEEDEEEEETEEEKDEDDNEENLNKIAEKNIMIMLRLMFPTKYPMVGNIFTSFDSVITGKNQFHLKWTDFIPSFFKKKLFEGLSDYSYLKIDEKIYTITQVFWLNDIYNHKEYKKLVEQFEQLQKWKDNESRKGLVNLDKKREQFQQSRRNTEVNFTEQDIENIKETLSGLEQLQKGNINVNNIREYKTTVNEIIENIRKYIDLLQTDEYVRFIETSKILYESFSFMFSKYREFTPKNRNKYEKIIEKLKEDIEKIQSDEYILKKYLQSPGINMDYERDKYRFVLEKDYGLYIRFVENIKKYRAPILESSNSFLQDSIEDFLNNTEKYKGVFNFLMSPLNLKKNPYQDLIVKNEGMISDVELEGIKKEAKHYEKRLNTGVTIRPNSLEDQPYYEIYVQVNVIGGELNDKNKSVIDCMFQGESLTEKLSRLLNEAIYKPWNINSSRIFLDITEGEAKAEIDKQTKETEPEVSEVEVVQGGTRKYRQQLIKKSRRRYYR